MDQHSGTTVAVRMNSFIALSKYINTRDASPTVLRTEFLERDVYYRQLVFFWLPLHVSLSSL